MIKRLFTSHPASVGETYGQHLVQALSFAAAMFAGAVPSMCKRTGSRIIMRLHDRMVVNRARPFP
jgi:hypothetical protein